MKTPVFFGIALRIIILFGVAMMATFLPEMLRGFFGDVKCNPCHQNTNIDVQYYWGARHYWYVWMMAMLFILSVINIIMAIVGLIDKHYPNS